MNPCGRAKISSENDTKRELWLTSHDCLAAESVRHEKQRQMCIVKHATLPGILMPEMTAPDRGATRGRPMGTVTAMRSVSLMTAVCSAREERARVKRTRIHSPRMGVSRGPHRRGDWSSTGHAARTSSTAGLCFAEGLRGPDGVRPS
jgi:hypothetical protein